MKRSDEENNLIELLKNYQDVTEFKYMGDFYTRSTKLRSALNKMFASDIKACYSTGNDYVFKNKTLDFSSDSIIFVNSKGTIVKLTNSEWAFFKYIS